MQKRSFEYKGSTLRTPLLGSNRSRNSNAASNFQSRTHSDGSSITLLYNSDVEIHKGVPTYTVKYLNNRRFDYHHTFSEDGSRLLTYDHEQFRIWDTTDFTELGRLDVYEDMFYHFCASICFVGNSTERFVAFYADGPVFEGRILSNPSAVEITAITILDIKPILIKTLGASGSMRLKFLCNHDWMSVYECADHQMQIPMSICLMTFRQGIQWTFITLDPSYKSGEDFSTYLNDSSLLRIEKVVSREKTISQIRFWPKIDFQYQEQCNWIVLDGVDGRFSMDGRAILTWKNNQDSSQGFYSISIYDIQALSKYKPRNRSDVHPPPSITIPLEEGLVLYYAQLIPSCSQNAFPLIPSSSQNAASNKRLAILSDVPWSPTSRIFIFDVQTNTVTKEIDTRFRYRDTFRSPTGLDRRWFHRNGPFVIAPDGSWLFYGYPFSKEGTLFSLHNPEASYIITQHKEHQPLDPTVQFDPMRRWISSQLEGGLSIALPPAWQPSVLERWFIDTTDKTLQVLEFLRVYDPSTFQRFLESDLEKDDILESTLFRWLLSDGILSFLLETIQEMGEEFVRHVAFSPDARFVAFVLCDDPVQVQFYSLSDLKDGKMANSDCLFVWYGPSRMDAHSHSSLALFPFRSLSEPEFFLVYKNRHEVHLTWLEMQSFEVKARHRRWLRQMNGLYRIWTTNLDQVHLLVSFGVLQSYDLNQRTEIEARSLMGDEGVPLDHSKLDHHFVHLNATSVHHKEVDVLGYDFVNSALLTSSNVGTTPILIDGMTLGLVLWMNAKRALVLCRDYYSPFKVVMVDTTGRRPNWKVEIYAERIPKLKSTFSEFMNGENVGWNIPTTPDHLRAFCACFLCAFRTILPTGRHLDILGLQCNPILVQRFIATFDRNFFNHKLEPSSKTLVQEMIAKRQSESLKAVFESSKEKNVSIDVRWGEEDLLTCAMNDRLQSSIEFAFEKLLSRSMSVQQTAQIFKKHFQSLITGSPIILEKALSRNQLCYEFGEFAVPVGIFDKTWILTQTSCDIPNWTENNNEEARWYWKRMSREMQTSLETGEGTWMMARYKVVAIADLAQVGMAGILRPLLMSRCSVELFATDIVRWTIQYKWEKFWRSKFLVQAVVYVILMASFSSYAYMIAAWKFMMNGLPWSLLFTNVALAISIFISLFDMIGEVRQIRRYAIDQEKGLKYYLSLPWNWIEIISALLILVCIPSMHVLVLVKHFGESEAAISNAFKSEITNEETELEKISASSETILSGFIAMECILLWFKVLYLLQPFRRTGPLVAMIRKIIYDIIVFLGLLFTVMTGFSFAFYVVFQAESKDEDIPLDSSFGNLGKCFETLFFSILGDFDLQTYHDAGDLAWMALGGFYLYMLIEAIVFLNLLIAIMGDTYDRVKLTEEAELMKCRAMVIDDGEAAMTDKEIEEMKSCIGTYLHVLMPADPHVAASAGLPVWKGRVHALETRIRRAMSEKDNKMTNQMDQLVEENAFLKEQLERIESQCKDVQQNVKERSDVVQAQLEELQSSLSLLHDRLDG